MMKTILITGATDGIGLATAKVLLAQGHRVLLHGRNQAKLDDVANSLATDPGTGEFETYIADLSTLSDVNALADAITAKHSKLDVLINNAGILKSPSVITNDGLDIRFVVNTLAPYLLTKRLLPIIESDGRIINLSSAAQAPIDLDAMAGKSMLSDMEAYAQSKLAITMWSQTLAAQIDATVVAVNPGSLLGTKMVKEGFGTEGKDISIGSEILRRAALDDYFGKSISGQYFDNDSGRFASPHPDAMNETKTKATVDAIEKLVDGLVS